MAMPHHEVLDLTGQETRSKWLIFRLPKCIVVLTRTELLACLAMNPEVFTKAIRRGKIVLRRRKRAERAFTPGAAEKGEKNHA